MFEDEHHLEGARCDVGTFLLLSYIPLDLSFSLFNPTPCYIPFEILYTFMD
jgi:hypothetical protein